MPNAAGKGARWPCVLQLLCCFKWGTEWKNKAQYQVFEWKSVGFWTLCDDMSTRLEAWVSQTQQVCKCFRRVYVWAPVASKLKVLWACNLHLCIQTASTQSVPQLDWLQVNPI